MNIISNLLNLIFFPGKVKEKEIKRYNEISEKAAAAVKEYNKLINKNSYINFYDNDKYKKDYAEIYSIICSSKKYLKLKLPEEIIRSIQNFKDIYSKFDEICSNYNEQFIAFEKRNFKELFDNIEGRALDDQQRSCIIKDEINNLVIAGAGSGKTTTIVGKVKYLIKRYNYRPDEILVLSFTNASAAEMAERIKNETNENIDVMTFHKLGLNIISEVLGKKPSIFDDKLYDFVADIFNKLTKDADYNERINNFFLSYLRNYRSRFDFESEGDYIEYLRDEDIRTLKGERVKSYEEMEIANFLFINHIKYEYERKYEFNTANKGHSQYVPDFYLPDYKIYIEHFGIDRQGNVPGFFEGKNGKTAKQIYNEGIAWKRDIHKKYNTILLESYSFEKAEGVLTKNLKNKLEANGVKFDLMDRNEVWGLIEKQNSNELTSFVQLMTTFINQLKSNNRSIMDMEDKNRNYFSSYNFKRNEAFIKLVEPVYNIYQNALKESGDIDFNDMINLAAEYVENGEYTKKYSYIIVDEYQDISLARYKLIKAIKDRNNSKLFCVGDDWQSIYRFAGSQIDLFTSFEKYFGYTEKSYIETTYRFNKNLIDISSKFILKNRNQIKKQLKPFNVNDAKSVDILYGDNLRDLNISLKQKLNEINEDNTVALIGRYNYKIDLQPYLDNELSCKYDVHKGEYNVYYRSRKDLNIKYYTIHRSKGLQADYVFILNNTNKKLGFPSQIEDDPVLKLFESNTESFEFAEERRLMYVALTRAKKFVYLMVENNNKSVFIRELEKDFYGEASTEHVTYCPRCKTGKLILRSGPYSSFYGCSNYPLCKYTTKISNQGANIAQ